MVNPELNIFQISSYLYDTFSAIERPFGLPHIKFVCTHHIMGQTYTEVLSSLGCKVNYVQ